MHSAVILYFFSSFSVLSLQYDNVIVIMLCIIYFHTACGPIVHESELLIV